MCFGCYVVLGEPMEFTPAIPRVVELCKQLYVLAGAGGNCHIVTDDWNLNEESIDHCIESVKNGGIRNTHTGDPYETDPAQLAIEKELLDLLKPLTVAQRGTALALWSGFITRQ
jgi:hypothetical protein